MHFHEFLSSLSKEELITILIRLSSEQKYVSDFLLKKIHDTESTVNRDKESFAFTFTDIQNYTTRESAPREKINLFKSIFMGRKDAFALRWYNSQTNKTGYSPVCANKWAKGKCDLKKYSCNTCPYKKLIPLNDNYIFNHLRGSDEFCRDVIGLYPLEEGNVCSFLAIDFDGNEDVPTDISNDDTKEWRKDILAVHATCKEFSIPSYIEISRSGNGAHLWIFFSEKISAKLARDLGSAIVKVSMQNRHSISFKGFDRFFPNQDEIPKGGYGNLIALPLQGKAVKNNCSVFVDENFIPYDDQWYFLSHIKKINKTEVMRIVGGLEKSLSNFFEKNETEDEKKVIGCERTI